MSMVEEIGTLLDTTFDWLYRPSTAPTGTLPNFFWYSMPDDPSVADEAYAIYQYPGQQATRKLQSGVQFERPRLQVLGRAPKIKPVWDHMKEIKNFLNDQQSVSIGGVYYLDIFEVSDLGELGSDTKNRQRVVCNFQVSKEPS